MKPLPECPLCGAKCLKTPTGYSFRGGCQFYSVGCQRDTPDLCIYQGIPLPLHRILCALIAKLRAVGKVQDERKVQRALTRHDQGRAQLLHPERLMRGTGERRAGK